MRVKALTGRGTLQIGDMTVDCYVLEDERRVLSKNGMIRALSNGARERGTLGRYLDRLSSRNEELTLRPEIEFDLRDGGVATGHEACDLVTICQAYQAGSMLQVELGLGAA